MLVIEWIIWSRKTETHTLSHRDGTTKQILPVQESINITNATVSMNSDIMKEKVAQSREFKTKSANIFSYSSWLHGLPSFIKQGLHDSEVDMHWWEKAR